MSLLARPTTQPGNGNMPKMVLSTADGARAEIYLHGAHLTSWVPAGGSEALFLSPKAEFVQGSAIRGGVPVIFPQFSDLGPLPKHGFARTLDWEPVASPPNQAVLRLFSLRRVIPHIHETKTEILHHATNKPSIFDRHSDDLRGCRPDGLLPDDRRASNSRRVCELSPAECELAAVVF